jgi:translocation and assembly module TamB
MVIPELGLGGLSFTALQWDFDARRIENAWVGETSLGSQSSAGTVDLQASLNWPDELPLEISVQDSRIAEAMIAGSFALPPGDVPASGMFRVTGNPLSPLGQYFAQPAASSGTVEIGLQLGGDTPSVDVGLALEEVRFGETLGGAELEGDLAYDIAAQRADAQLHLSEGANAMSFEAAADLGEETRVTVETLEGSWAGTPLRLLQPAMLRRSEISTSLPEAVFAIGEGRAEISGNGNQDGIEARIALISIPIEPLMDLRGYRDAQGEINANLYARMTPAISEGSMTLSLDDFAFANIAREIVPADLTMNGNWNGAELSITGEVSGLDEMPATFSASLPLRRAGEGYSVAVQNDAPITGAFEGSARAERFMVLLPIAEHSLTGLISASLQLSGTPAEPVFTGQARLQDGSYESLEIGTRLEELNLNLEAAANGALSMDANATDGGAGRLNASGTISFDENAQPFGSADIEIANAYLAQRDEYAARGSGEISFDFPEGGTGAISGMITTSEVRVDLGQPLPPGIEEIDVVEVNRPAELGALAEEEPPPEADFVSMAMLDIEIDMPNNIRVEGYGVEAIWEGNIEIGGTVGMPAISGEINLARGIAELLGRQFTLDEGSVVPDPSVAGSARIDISGSYEQNDLSVEVTISGPAASPEITWSSVPALPRDEIISRLYFGRASPQLTAYEAIQLAQLSGALGGLGGPGGVVGFARRVAGLDVLRIEPPENGDIANPTVTVGKYVTDRVYVGARRDADTSSGAVEVEVEITPNISAEVETGSDDSQAAGVNWHWHY